MKFSDFSKVAKDLNEERYATMENFALAMELRGSALTKQQFKAAVLKFFETLKPEVSETLSSSENLLFLVEGGYLSIRTINQKESPQMAKQTHQVIKQAPKTPQVAAKSKKVTKKPGQVQKNIFCKFCGTPGHWFSECKHRN